MDSDSFFGFDASLPLDEEDVDDDDEYDALNDETFGASAVGGDWEENHKQLSSLTEAERLHRAIGKDVGGLSRGRQGPAVDYRLNKLSKSHDLRQTLESLSLDNGSEKKRLFERSVGSSPLVGFSHQADEPSMSPGNSIWSPTTVRFTALDNIQQLQFNTTVVPPPPSPSSPSPLSNLGMYHRAALNGLTLLRSNTAPVLPDFGGLGLQGAVRSAVQTVSELEDELKRQHSNPPPGVSNFSTMTVEDLERELSKQAAQLRKGDCSPFSNTFPSARLPTSNILHSQSQPPIVIQSKLPSTHSSTFHQPNAAGGSKSSGNMMGLYHHYLNPASNKGMSPGFAHTPPNVYPPGGRPGGPFLHQGSHRPVVGNKGGFFHSGTNHGRNNAHHKPNMYERHFDFLFGSPHPPQHEKRGSQGCGSGGGPPGAGGRVRRDSDAEWEEWQLSRQMDEYAGLMTPREKSWLRNIQALQLHTDNPYQDDYYFVMHKAKQQRRREEEALEMDGLQLHLLSEQQQQCFGIGNRDGSGGTKEGGYEPPKLENSLGKLQVASVNAPRKIIDLQVVHLDPSHPTTSLQRDMRRHRHLLLHVEKLYTLQIELDDLERKIRALPDCPTRDSFRSKCRHLVTRLWAGLTTPHESFVQLLCIRKGKTLAARLLNWVGQEEVEHFLATVVQNLPLLTKRDSHDGRLPLFWPFADRFFSRSLAPTLLSFGVMMEPQLRAHKQNFIPAVASQLGLSMVLSLLLRGEELWEEVKDDLTWQQFLRDTIHGLSSLAAGQSTTSSNPLPTLSESAKTGSARIQPLPSVTLAASPGALSSHLLRYRDAPGSAATPSPNVTRAIVVLNGFEAHLTKNTPPPKPGVLLGSSSPASSSSETRNPLSPHGLSHFSHQEPNAMS